MPKEDMVIYIDEPAGSIYKDVGQTNSGANPDPRVWPTNYWPAQPAPSPGSQSI